MSIAINPQKCKACGACMNVCPGSLIKKREDGKALMKYPRDCWGCSSCIKECKFGAISFFLGADIGGKGSKMSTKIDGDLVDWNIEGADGNVKTITIDRKDANRY